VKIKRAIWFSVGAKAAGELVARRPPIRAAALTLPAALLDHTIGDRYLLLRYDPIAFDLLASRSLDMTRAPFRRAGGSYLVTVAGDQLRIELTPLLQTVAVLDFRANWSHRKALVVKGLILKSLGPVLPRIVIRLGGGNATD
jgi:hypothetical protein